MWCPDYGACTEVPTMWWWTKACAAKRWVMKIDYKLIDHIIHEYSAISKVDRIGLDFRRWFWYRFKSFQYCTACGKSFWGNPEQCDFHHMEPSKKEHTLASIGFGMSTVAKIYGELKKCYPYCASCHRTKHRNLSDLDRILTGLNLSPWQTQNNAYYIYMRQRL